MYAYKKHSISDTVLPYYSKAEWQLKSEFFEQHESSLYLESFCQVLAFSKNAGKYNNIIYTMAAIPI